jgi:KaiC/GvpD/RAD55 family RecA-like ATPase
MHAVVSEENFREMIAIAKTVDLEEDLKRLKAKALIRRIKNYATDPDLDVAIASIKHDIEHHTPTGTLSENERMIATINCGLVSEENLIRYYKDLPSGIDIGLKIGEDSITFPAGGYSVIAAPTKQGKTHALVNAAYTALERDKDLQVLFVTLEELSHPILLRFMNRHIELTLSKNNAKTLSHFYKHIGTDKELEMFGKGTDLELFHNNRRHFENAFLKTGRLRILDLASDGGKLVIVENLCKKIEDVKRWLPNVRMIAIDYIQLITIEKPGRLSRDEILKEVCLQLKDVAAKTGLAIVTAAQFNRTVQNEDDLHSSAIGEGGSIERHASLVIGMWNRTFPQNKGGNPMVNKPTENKILLDIMLNRHGPGNQKALVDYDGNIGKIQFNDAKDFDSTPGKSRQETPKPRPYDPNKFSGIP